MVTIEIDLDTTGCWNVSDDADELYDLTWYDCEEYAIEQEANEDARVRALEYSKAGLEVLLLKNGKIWADA